MKMFFCSSIVMFFISFGTVCCNPAIDSLNFVNFLSDHHYLSGRQEVSLGDTRYIADIITRMGTRGILTEPSTASFASNIAYIAAQVQNTHIATDIVMQLYDKGQHIDLIDELIQNNIPITEEAINSVWERLYTSLWAQQNSAVEG